MLAFSVPIARESGHLVRAIAEKATIDQALADTGAASCDPGARGLHRDRVRVSSSASAFSTSRLGMGTV
jgi:hypothetical protein